MKIELSTQEQVYLT